MGRSNATSAAEFLVCTLLDPITAQERTYRFIGGNYSWETIFSTLEKIQGAEWKAAYKAVEEARGKSTESEYSGDIDLSCINMKNKGD
jgi:hypothetical protein